MQDSILASTDFGDPACEVSPVVRLNWQAEVRRLIGMMASHTSRYPCRSAGIDIVVLPQVFSPAYFTDSEWFASEIAKLASGRTLLDIGTGTGIIALAAAKRGALVTATDINPHAVENARINFAAHGVAADVFEGDVYAAVADCSRFDLIFWNHPFNLGTNPREDALSLCGFDYQYNGVRQFIGGAPAHLAPGGRLLLGTSTFAEVALIEQIADGVDFDVRVIARKRAPLQWRGEAVTELRICEFVARTRS
jgi:release factor glutamine methyltransferase